MDKLTLAVECCTTRSCEWDETCGKCPFNTRSEDQIGIDMANCIDELILSLYKKIKELEEKLTPVQHGEWTNPEFQDNDTGTATATCSICGTRGKVRINRNEWGIWHINNKYCPNCGACIDRGKINE